MISLLGLVSMLIGYALEAAAPSLPVTVTPRTSSSPRTTLEAASAEMKGASFMAGKAGTTRVGRKGTDSSVLPGEGDIAITTAANKIAMVADADRILCTAFYSSDQGFWGLIPGQTSVELRRMNHPLRKKII